MAVNDDVTDKAPSPYVNIADPRQDVHRVRVHEASLARYAAAEGLLPANPGAVLELGGGIAEFSRRLRGRGNRVTFVDLSETNVRRAADDGFETHRLDLNYPLPFEDETFDGVTMLEIIEHVVAAEQLLAEVSRVLKPGGFVILSTPNFSFALNRARILLGSLSGDEGYHYRFFNPRVLEARFDSAGLSIDRTAHLMPMFGVNFVRSRLLGGQRAHVMVPGALAPLMAHTLVVRASKR
jgi:2-polyprenyl-3-methyl-5-hydroxy-6-metoxy-1,4-benzoquinol methylase